MSSTPQDTYPKIFPEIPTNALTELSGHLSSGKNSLIFSKFSHQYSRPLIAWVESPTISLNPCSLLRFNLNPDRFIFIESPLSNVLWCLRELTQSELFSHVVFSGKLSLQLRTQEVELRRLQIAAKTHQTGIVFISDTPTLTANWMFALQAKIHSYAPLDFTLLRHTQNHQTDFLAQSS